MSRSINSSSALSSDYDSDQVDEEDSTVFGDDESRTPSRSGGAKAVVAAPFKPIINFVKEKQAISTTKAALSVLLLIFAALASFGFAWLVEREERIRFENEVRHIIISIVFKGVSCVSLLCSTLLDMS